MYICRFQNFNEKPLKSFQALDYRSVPSERHQLASHGKEDLQDILNHMVAVFPEASHSQIQTEYVQLKVLMRQQQQSSEVPVSEVYARLLRTSPSAIKKVVMLMMVVSPSTAECERGFSCMRLIKTSTRNCANQETLQMLMTVKRTGPSLQDFDAEKAIRHWLACGKGGRHVHGHKC